jgi:hypothetical protein
MDTPSSRESASRSFSVGSYVPVSHLEIVFAERHAFELAPPEKVLFPHSCFEFHEFYVQRRRGRRR